VVHYNHTEGVSCGVLFRAIGITQKKGANMKTVTMGAILFVFLGCMCATRNVFGQSGATAVSKNSATEPLEIDSALRQELSQLGIDQNSLKREPGNFFDGSFQLTAKIIDALKAGKLFVKDPAMRDELVQTINSQSGLLFPWDTVGSASVVVDGGNAMAEMRGDTTISQDIVFQSRKATLQFDLYVVSAGEYDAFEVLLVDQGDALQPRTVSIASYNLARADTAGHVSIDLSVIKAFNEIYAKSDLYLAFHLKPNKNKAEPVIVRLDNFNLSYGQ